MGQWLGQGEAEREKGRMQGSLFAGLTDRSMKSVTIPGVTFPAGDDDETERQPPGQPIGYRAKD